MKATTMDLRRNMKDILRALDRNEEVTLYYRGKKKARIVPINGSEAVGETRRPIAEHPAVGMWADREDMADVEAYVRKLRRSRVHDL